jgi:hypothetical protein
MKYSNVENYTYCNLLKRYLKEGQAPSAIQKRLTKIIIDEVAGSPEHDDFLIEIPVVSVIRGNGIPQIRWETGIKETLKEMITTRFVVEQETDDGTCEFASLYIIAFSQYKGSDETISLKIPLSGFRDLYIVKLKTGAKIKIER